MLYFDTSFLVPLVLPEATSARITTFVRKLAADELAVSHWARVEFSSLLAREMRMGGLDAPAASQADARFEAMITGSFTTLVPREQDFTLAKQYLRRFETGLRAGDALHIAIASGHGATVIYSLDKKLIKAGAMLGLPISDGTGAN